MFRGRNLVLVEPTIKRLASGSLVQVDEKGRATHLRCPWHVAVRNPEPDGPDSEFFEVECGAKMVGLRSEGDKFDACSAGHTYGGLAYEWRADFEREQAERHSHGMGVLV